MPARIRPTSPHLQIYRWQIGNSLSLLHRLTGIALSLGLAALCAWLIALAGGEESLPCGGTPRREPRGHRGAHGVTFAFLYHLLNGVRHLLWDAGFGFERRQRHASGWLAVIGAVALSACRGRASGTSSACEPAQSLGAGARLGIGQGRHRALVGATGERGCAGAARPVVLLFAAAAALVRLRHGPRLAGCAAERLPGGPAGRSAVVAFLSRHLGDRGGLCARQGHEGRAADVAALCARVARRRRHLRDPARRLGTLRWP